MLRGLRKWRQSPQVLKSVLMAPAHPNIGQPTQQWKQPKHEAVGDQRSPKMSRPAGHPLTLFAWSANFESSQQTLAPRPSGPSKCNDPPGWARTIIVGKSNWPRGEPPQVPACLTAVGTDYSAELQFAERNKYHETMRKPSWANIAGTLPTRQPATTLVPPTSIPIMSRFKIACWRSWHESCQRISTCRCGQREATVAGGSGGRIGPFCRAVAPAVSAYRRASDRSISGVFGTGQGAAGALRRARPHVF